MLASAPSSVILAILPRTARCEYALSGSTIESATDAFFVMLRSLIRPRAVFTMNFPFA